MSLSGPGVETDAQDREGGCQCGDIRFSVTGPSVWKAGCCCRSCTRSHGAPYVVWAGFGIEAFRWLSGRPAIFRSSPHVLRSFCPRCGTRLTYQKDPAIPRYQDAAKVIYVAVATLDDPNAFPPDEVVRAAERATWFNPGNSIPFHDDLSPDKGQLQTGSPADTREHR